MELREPQASGPAILQTAKALRAGQSGSNGLLQCSDYAMNDCTPPRSEAMDIADVDRPTVPTTGGTPEPCDDALVPLYAPDVEPVYGPQCQLENTDV